MESSTQGLCAPLSEDPIVREDEHLTEHSRLRVRSFESDARQVEITSTIETPEGVKAVLLRFGLTHGLALELSRMLSGANSFYSYDLTE